MATDWRGRPSHDQQREGAEVEREVPGYRIPTVPPVLLRPEQLGSG
jgi:hypothetical protein